MPMDERGGDVAAELAALDHILIGESVGEEHLELAALVDSVRAGAPTIPDRFDAALRARLAAAPSRRGGAGFTTRITAPRRTPRHAQPWRTALTWRGRKLLAATGVIALVIAVVVVVVSARGPGSSPAPHPGAVAGAPATPQPASAARSSSTGAQAVGAPPSAGRAASGGAATSAGAPGSAPAPAGGRLVQRGAALMLSTSAAALQGVSDRVVSTVERFGGIVESSNVDVQGASSQATFSLSVPSSELSQLIGALSRLAHVSALSQDTQDITDAYDQARSRLATSRAQRDALLSALARATTPNQTASIQAQLDAIAGRIAGQIHAVDALQAQGRNATLQVTVVPGAAAVVHTDPPPGPVRRGLHDALRVLEVMLEVTLIALAVLVPLAAAAAAVTLGAAAWRRRQREGVLGRL